LKKGRAILKTDWFYGVIVVLVVLIFSRSDLMQSLEYKAYDLGVRASSKVPSDKIAIIAIDDALPASGAGHGRAKCTRK
jgi:CHASE2 domain-containing sensor protein